MRSINRFIAKHFDFVDDLRNIFQESITMNLDNISPHVASFSFVSMISVISNTTCGVEMSGFIEAVLIRKLPLRIEINGSIHVLDQFTKNIKRISLCEKYAQLLFYLKYPNNKRTDA